MIVPKHGKNAGKTLGILALRRACAMVMTIAAMTLGAGVHDSRALQRHSLEPTQKTSEAVTATETAKHGAPAKSFEHENAPRQEATRPETHTGAVSHEKKPRSHETIHLAPLPLEPELEKAPKEHRIAKAPHEGEMAAGEAGHGEQGVELPQISPIPGVTFVETMIRLMDHEINSRFLGWRPNDLILGRFTDNINNFQLGVLEAMRFTTLRLKDSLTRMGEADTYDKDLEDALNLFMNKATLFWFPSAEASYSEAVDHLRKFLQKLKSGRRAFYYRVDNFQALVASYADLLGNVNKSLIISHHGDGTPVSWFEVDDYFYYAKGVAHVLYEILKVARVGFENQLVTIDAVDILDEVLHELHRAEEMDPLIVLDSDLDGFFANHRANLNAPLSEAAHLLNILTRF